jgi:hypothetical protein
MLAVRWAITSRFELTITGFWIDDRVYWTLLIQSVATIFGSLLYTHTLLSIHVLTSRCLATTSNGGRCPSSGFLNCHRPQLPASHSNSSQGLNRSCSLTDPLTNCNKVKVTLRLEVTANQFILEPNPLRLTTRDLFFQLNPCSNSPYVTSSLTRRWICLL